MAGSLTNFGELKVADALFGGAALGAPATWYLAAFTVAPTEAGGGTEVAGGSYARLAVANNLSNLPSANPKVNAALLAFAQASAAWGNVVAVAWMDAASGGNMWAYTTLDTPKDIANLDTLQFAAGALSAAFD